MMTSLKVDDVQHSPVTACNKFVAARWIHHKTIFLILQSSSDKQIRMTSSLLFYWNIYNKWGDNSDDDVIKYLSICLMADLKVIDCPQMTQRRVRSSTSHSSSSDLCSSNFGTRFAAQIISSKRWNFSSETNILIVTRNFKKLIKN